MTELTRYDETLVRAGVEGRPVLAIQPHLGVLRSGRARFPALTLRAQHSYLATLARRAGRSSRPTSSD